MARSIEIVCQDFKVPKTADDHGSLPLGVTAGQN